MDETVDIHRIKIETFPSAILTNNHNKMASNIELNMKYIKVL